MPEQEKIATGTVKSWHASDGWGVIESADVPGDVFVHYSAIDSVTSGYRELEAFANVTFSWEAAQQDEFSFRAVRVFSSGEPGVPLAREIDAESPSEAFSSSFEIVFDEEDEGH